MYVNPGSFQAAPTEGDNRIQEKATIDTGIETGSDLA